MNTTTLNKRLLGRLVFSVMAESRATGGPSLAWNEAEDQFLREHIAWMTDAEIGAQLGRSEIAVHLRWSRDLHLPSRSRHPDVITAHQAAEMLGIDGHKTAYWVDCGLIHGRLMPGERKIRLIHRTFFRHWVLDPMNWVYFDPKKVRDPELKRMCRKRAQRWGDAWWTIPQVARYHGVDPKNVYQTIRRGRLRSFHLPVSRGGRDHNRKWSNHFVLRSVAKAAVFYTGKGSGRKISKFTPAGDAWLLRARDELGMTFIEIGRTMKIGEKSYHHRTNSMIAYRYKYLKAKKRKATKR